MTKATALENKLNWVVGRGGHSGQRNRSQQREGLGREVCSAEVERTREDVRLRDSSDSAEE